MGGLISGLIGQMFRALIKEERKYLYIFWIILIGLGMLSFVLFSSIFTFNKKLEYFTFMILAIGYPPVFSVLLTIMIGSKKLSEIARRENAKNREEKKP